MVDVINRLTGQVESLSEDEAAAAIVDSGGTTEVATPEEVARDQANRQYGSFGQQALGAAELAARTASFGLVDGFGSDEAVRGREQVLKTESPAAAFVAQAAGSLVPGLGAAGIAGKAAGALGLGARAAGLGTALAEGAAVGTAEELENARFEDRDISIGNILLYGVGGELAGRALPYAARKVARSFTGDATSAIAGEAAENLAVRAEQQSLKRAARDVDGMKPGPARDDLLARTANEQYDNAAKLTRQALDTSVPRFDVSSDIPKSKYKQIIAKDAPVQLQWGTEAASELDNLAKTATGKTRKVISDASQSLFDSTRGLDTFYSAKQALKEISKLPASAEREAAQAMLRQGTERVDLWGKAAEFESDLNRTVSKFTEAKQVIQKAFGQGDTFDPAKIRNTLKQDKLTRTLIEENITKMADAIDDRIAMSQKWNVNTQSGLDALKKDATKLRSAFGRADEVQAAVSIKDALNKKSDPKAGRTMQDALGDFAVDRAAGAVGAGIGTAVGGPVGGLIGFAAGEGTKRLLRGVSSNGKAAIANTARKLIKPVVGKEFAPARVAGVATALSRFQGEYPGYRESFEAKKETLQAIQSDPTVLADAVSESFGLLPEEDPELFMKLTARIGQAYNYVTENMPASVATSLLYPRGAPPSEDSIREFAIQWNSAMHPETVLDDIEEGTAVPQQISALKAVHPDIYQELLDNVINEVANNFGEIPSQTKVWLDILFDADGIAGPGFSSKAADYVQQSLQKGGAPAPRENTSPVAASAPATSIQNIKTSVTNRGAGA